MEYLAFCGVKLLEFFSLQLVPRMVGQHLKEGPPWNAVDIQVVGC